MEKSIAKLDKIDLISEIFLLPKEELDRLFLVEGDMNTQLVDIFIGYCTWLMKKLQPHLKTRKN